MESKTIKGVTVAFVDYSGKDDLKVPYMKKLAEVALFMGATGVVYKDGKNEEYTFTKADGTMLKLFCGHHIHPGAGFLSFEV